MIFALTTHRSHKNISAFTHIKYRHFLSDVRGEEHKESINSNFCSIESRSKIYDLRYEKFNFSSQKHRRGVNSFDYEN